MWRRGTVPIWWGVEMKNGGLGDTDVVIAATNPYQGTKRRASNTSCWASAVIGVNHCAPKLFNGSGSIL